MRSQSFSAAVLLSCLLAPIVHAAPPTLTGKPVQAQLPRLGEGGSATVFVNLRQLGVVAGSGPLQAGLAQPNVFVNGEPERRLPARVFRGVCIRIDNIGYEIGANDFTYHLQLAVRNQGQGSAGPQLVRITNTPGPVIDPENAEDVRACDDPNTRPAANAGADRRIADSDAREGEAVDLDGRQSSDPDPGTILNYVWTNAQGAQIATGPAPQDVRLPDGDNVITLSVTDDSFDKATSTSTDTVTISVAAAVQPQPPRANAGQDQTVPDSDREAGENVTLNGTGSTDPDGTIASYVWRNAAGATLATMASAQVRLPDGSNTITLTVTDNAGLTSSDSVVVNVTAPPANRAPTANAGPNQTVADTDRQPGENVTLDGRQSSDPDGTIASYVWRNDAGAQVATGANPQVRVADGTSKFTLTVTDNNELTDTDTVSITVGAANRAPTANAGPDQSVADSDGQAGENVTLDGRQSSDPDGTIVSYVWRNDAGAQLATGANPQLRVPDGTSTITLTVTDNGRLTATDTVTIRVGAANRPPVANAGPDQNVADTDGQAGETVTLDGRQSSDANGSIVSYIWRNEAGVQVASGANPQVRAPDGASTFTLTVTDSGNVTDTDTVAIRVGAANRAPTANAGPNQNVADTDRQPGENVTLNGAQSSDQDGTIASYVWRDSAGTQLATGATAQVRLPDNSTTIVLTVTDNAGATATDSVVINVGAPPGRPRANAGSDQTIADTDRAPGETITLDGSGSVDPAGPITSFIWRNAAGTQIASGATARIRIADGSNPITLTITGPNAVTASDTVVITVAAPVGPAPRVNAGADQTVADTDRQAGEDVTLDASGSTDAGGEITSYVWRNASGAQVATGVKPRVRLPDGSNVITLTATDNDGLSATDSVVITVAAANRRAPGANAGADQTVADTDRQPGEDVTLDASGSSNADGEITSYEWRNASGTQIATGVNPRVRLPDGANVITLTTTNGDGLAATDSVLITVAAPVNQAPVASAGADQTVADSDQQPGENVTLDASASTDTGGEIASYEWRNAAGTQIATGATAQVRLPDGANEITLTATDGEGLSATDTILITVAAPPNQLPVANAGVDRNVADSDQRPGETVVFDGSLSSDTDGTIVSYVWRNSSGTEIANGVSASVRLADGSHTIALTVTDDDGVSAADTVTITVAKAPAPTTLAELPNLTKNQRAIATALDDICNRFDNRGDGAAALTQDQEDLRRRCTGLRYGNTQANQVEALTELNGEDFAVARTQTLLFANTQFVSVMDRLIALRGGARGLSLAGLSISVNGEILPIRELYAMASELLGGGASADEASGADLLGDKWGMWARGNYSFGEKDASAASPRFEADQWALVGGIDYRFSNRTVGGLALAYGGSEVQFDPLDEGALDTRSWALSAYGSMYAAKNFYLDAIVNFTNAQYDAERNISYADGIGLVDVDAAGDTKGLTLSGGLSAGYDFLVGGLTVSPNLGFYYIDATIDGFTENGAGGLNLVYDEQNFRSLTGNLGLRMTYAWNLPWGVLLPHLRVDYVREFEDDVDVFGVRFASDPNATSTAPILIETENPDSSYWRLATGFSAQFTQGISAYIEYQRLEGFDLISFQDISMGLRLQKRF